MEHLTIRLNDPESFVKLIETNEVKMAFTTRDEHDPYRSRRYLGIQTKLSTWTIVIPNFLGVKEAMAIYDERSSVPQEWDPKDSTGMLTRSLESKKELLEFLEENGANEGDIKKISKLKVSTLKEFIDASDKEWDEVRTRTKEEASNFMFETLTGQFKTVCMDVKRGRGAQLAYVLTVDWTKELQEIRDTVTSTLKKTPIFNGSINY